MWRALPPAQRALDVRGWDELSRRTIAGAFHVHTTRSDGHGDRAQIAAAAKRAGLQFVIITDHGDATRQPDAPEYVDGVLVLDGVEISTEDGHYIAIDMPRSPYPLGGRGDSVVDDVRRLGGFGVAAHPDSPKPALRWTSTARPDAVEWLSLDSEWRDETRAQLFRAGAAYLLRRGPGLAMILDRPVTLDARWPALLAQGPSVAVAAADAHGGVGRRYEDTGRNVAGSVGIPSYEASFRAFSNHVILSRPLSGDAAADARAIYAAIRGGSLFSAIDAQAGPALLQFTVETGFQKAEMGAVLPEDSDATLIVRAPVPADTEISILRNGRTMTSNRGPELRYVVTGGQGAYRAEILIPGGPGLPPVPWVVSNPIYFSGEGRPIAPPTAPPLRPPVAGTIAPFPWRIEKDASSSATLRTGATDATLEYKLGGGDRSSQFVALATDLRAPLPAAIELALAGDRPMRVWVQLRAGDGSRWGRTYYVDPAGNTIEVPISALAPLGKTLGPVRDPQSLLVVIDLTNAAPGQAGRLRVLSSALK